MRSTTIQSSSRIIAATVGEYIINYLQTRLILLRRFGVTTALCIQTHFPNIAVDTVAICSLSFLVLSYKCVPRRQRRAGKAGFSVALLQTHFSTNLHTVTKYRERHHSSLKTALPAL
jgi:hypothetical protein